LAPGGKLAAFGSRRGEVTLWDGETGQARIFARPVTNRINRLVFSLDGRYLAAADEPKTEAQMAATDNDPRRTVRVWEVGARKEPHVFSTEGAFLTSPLTFSADAKVLVAGSSLGPVKLWQLDGPGGAATLLGHSGWVVGLALLPDGHTLISAGADIRFWDVRTRQENALKLSPRSDVNCIALSADGRRLAAGVGDGRITIWDVASHQEVATLDGHKEEVMQLAFTSDGNHLVSVSKDQLRVWHAASSADIEATEKEARK
jgi:WD40 repeat protein